MVPVAHPHVPLAGLVFAPRVSYPGGDNRGADRSSDPAPHQ
ncbi:hypothetical protein SCH4B_1560 [Ruegeria sp. TrichCH4B]|nr:hypothetical protein SCH4B_1560 [Ruegeria sp. TrichCH4B]